MGEYEEDMPESMVASVLHPIGEPDMPVVSRGSSLVSETEAKEGKWGLDLA